MLFMLRSFTLCQHNVGLHDSSSSHSVLVHYEDSCSQKSLKSLYEDCTHILAPLYEDCTHILGEQCIIYKQSPVESDNEELQKLFKWLSTMFIVGGCCK